MTSAPTDTAPLWRQAGAMALPGPAALFAGDPAYRHLDALDGVELTAGTWAWDVRDGAMGTGHARDVWEVRLRRADATCTADWAWHDANGQLAVQPTPGAEQAGLRDVDSATMAWLVLEHAYADLDNPEIDVDDLPAADGAVTHLGWHAFVCDTGEGDGTYPAAVRRAGGTVVEVRMLFLAPGPHTTAP